MLRAEKGDHQQCAGSFSRWILHEDPRPRRHEGAAPTRPAHAGPAARVNRRRGDHRKPRAWQSLHSRHRLRLRRYSQPVAFDADQARHSCEPDSQEKAASRPTPIRRTLPRRGLLSRPQALPGSCHALREDLAELSRPPPGRMLDDLASGPHRRRVKPLGTPPRARYMPTVAQLA